MLNSLLFINALVADLCQGFWHIFQAFIWLIVGIFFNLGLDEIVHMEDDFLEGYLAFYDCLLFRQLKFGFSQKLFTPR